MAEVPFFVALFMLGAVVLVFGVVSNIVYWLRGKHDLKANLVWLLRNIFSRNIVNLLETLVMEIFLQRRLFRQDKLRWAMKVFIIFGYVGIIVVNHIKVATRVPELHGMSELMLFFYAPFVDYYYLQGVASGAYAFETIDIAYALLNEIFGLMVIAGEGIAIYRRFVLKAFPLKTTLADKVAVVNLGGWFIFRFLGESASILAYNVDSSVAKYWFFSYGLSKVVAPLGGVTFNQLMWPLSALLLAMLFASIPFNKKLWHIFVSPFLMLINSLPYDHSAHEGKDSRIDFTSRQLVSMDACMKCQLCAENCQVYMATEDQENPYLSYAYINSHVKSHLKANHLRGLLMGHQYSEEEKEEFNYEVYNCLLCSRCAEVCPSLIETRDIGIGVRKSLHHQGLTPKKFNMPREAVLEKKNIANFPNTERAMWIDFFIPEPPEDYYQRESAEVVYFTGCMSSFSPQVQDIPAAMVQLLEKAGVNFTLLGEKEWCCGYPLILLGMKEDVEGLIEHNIEEIKKSGAKKIVFSCPSCYHTFSHEYPEMEGVELVHHTEFIKELIEEGRLELSQPLDTIASYHDPCDLGRNSGEYEVPRQVVRSLPGVDYREFPSNREMALCCGGGGDVEISNPELTSKVSRGVIEAASEVEARTIITACQQCKRVINSASKESAQGKYRVKDIAELVLEATEEKK